MGACLCHNFRPPLFQPADGQQFGKLASVIVGGHTAIRIIALTVRMRSITQ